VLNKLYNDQEIMVESEDMYTINAVCCKSPISPFWDHTMDLEEDGYMNKKVLHVLEKYRE